MDHKSDHAIITVTPENEKKQIVISSSPTSSPPSSSPSQTPKEQHHHQTQQQTQQERSKSTATGNTVRTTQETQKSRNQSSSSHGNSERSHRHHTTRSHRHREGASSSRGHKESGDNNHTSVVVSTTLINDNNNNSNKNRISMLNTSLANSGFGQASVNTRQTSSSSSRKKPSIDEMSTKLRSKGYLLNKNLQGSHMFRSSCPTLTIFDIIRILLSPPPNNTYIPIIHRRCFLLILLSFLYTLQYLFLLIFLKANLVICVVGVVFMLLIYILGVKWPRYDILSYCHVVGHCLINFAFFMSILSTNNQLGFLVIFQINLILNLLSISIFFPKLKYCIILITLLTFANIIIQIVLGKSFYTDIPFYNFFFPNIILNSITAVLVLFYSYISSIDLKESELKEKRIREMFNKSSEALLMHKDGIIIDANSSFEKLFQVKLNDILYPGSIQASSSVWEFLPEIERYFVKEPSTGEFNPFEIVTDLTSQGTPIDVEMQNQDRMKSPIVIDTIGINSIGETFSVHVTVEKGSKLNNFDMISIIDTSAREKLISASIALKKAEEINQTKVNLLTTVSHEVRTPINGILSAVDILEKSPLDPNQREFLNCVKVSADWVLDIISGILDFSKIEAGKMELVKIEFNILTMLEETLNILYRSAQVKGLELLLFIDQSIPLVLIGDPYRVKQVLINLMSNALKFTQKGQVIIRVKLLQAQIQAKDPLIDYKLLFEVEDSGIGIKQENIDNLFTAFHQVGSEQKHLGTGLGLSICKKLCVLMKGDIKANSMFGNGSTFSFTAVLYQKVPPRTPVLSGVSSSMASISELSLSHSKMENINNLADDLSDDDDDEPTLPNPHTISVGGLVGTISTSSTNSNRDIKMKHSSGDQMLTIGSIGRRVFKEFSDKQAQLLLVKSNPPVGSNTPTHYHHHSLLNRDGNSSPTMMRKFVGYVYDDNPKVCSSITSFFKMLTIDMKPLTSEQQLQSLFIDSNHTHNSLSDLDEANNHQCLDIGMFNKSNIDRLEQLNQSYLLITRDIKNIKFFQNRQKQLPKSISDQIYWVLLSDNLSDFDSMDCDFYSSFLKKPSNLPCIVECLFYLNGTIISEELYFQLTSKCGEDYQEHLVTFASRMEKLRHSKSPLSISLSSLPISVSPPISPVSQTLLVKPLKMQYLERKPSSYSDHIAITRGLVQVNRSPRTTFSAHSSTNNSEADLSTLSARSNIKDIEYPDIEIDMDIQQPSSSPSQNNNINSNNSSLYSNNSISINVNSDINSRDSISIKSTDKQSPLIQSQQEQQQPHQQEQSNDIIINIPTINIENGDNNYNNNNNSNSNNNNENDKKSPLPSPSLLPLSPDQDNINQLSQSQTSNQPSSRDSLTSSLTTTTTTTTTNNNNNGSGSSTTLGNSIDKNSFKVLLVDDNSVNIKVFSKFLKDGGYSIDVAWNGVQAVEFVKKSYYPIIFMDYHMSLMSGDEATEIIRKDEKVILATNSTYKKMTIIALTAMNVGENDSGRDKCLSCGMDDFIQKPVRNSMVLINMVGKYLKNYTAQDIENSREIKKSIVLGN
ncbi:histidine kinase [Tieghemostelium lacteum]|uniref:Histidine kinase n=1 Tax=Tieghemostelium lacteum TaxID=361077 RepID=A0A151Z3P0_TIELA|nr:histidine kinase [Tieghemostelium lacteum]|eukprot:KYQ88576.1 histidine kinase [Tieghemostelium lacteum]